MPLKPSLALEMGGSHCRAPSCGGSNHSSLRPSENDRTEYLYASPDFSRLLFSSQPFSHALAEKISNWLDSPISPQSKHGMDNFSSSDARAYAAHDRDDIKAALLPNFEAETRHPINSLSQRVNIFIFYSLRVSCSKNLVASGEWEEIYLCLEMYELSSFT